MSQSNIPNITSTIVISRKNAVTLLLSSIALEELGLSHILNSEGEKLQYILGNLPGNTPEKSATISDLLVMNRSILETLREVMRKEWALQGKLDSIVENDTSGNPAYMPCLQRRMVEKSPISKRLTKSMRIARGTRIYSRKKCITGYAQLAPRKEPILRGRSGVFSRI
ncbi:hypothetical protein SAMN04487866_11815 [Thermoactinomyces sp. DSM 45891]|uniref:hypothetical protein n=1 Tax=Thermoactinomyces sp. DSM 45891 TaxID=1761907 RepID=UPI00091BBCA6|nr:hypothetical protein [Thermoactinomyces sp. DSM 45891]SFX69323.1 hypothetical protein SAMN04487866_11815 [Thermoactinomyces sp. DSM 45891]